MNTKECQFCGNMLLAYKEQCHFCGEWLNNNESTKVATETVTSGDSPWYGHFAKTCIFAILFKLLFLGALVMELMPPFLMSLLLSYGLWFLFFVAYLMYGLRKHYLTIGANKPIPFKILIGVTVALFLCNIAVKVLTSINPENILFLIILLSTIVLSFIWYIMQFIVGLKLFNRMKTAPLVGIVVMLLAAFMFASDSYLIYTAYTNMFFYTITWTSILINSGVMIIFYVILYLFFFNMSREDRAYSKRYPR